MSYAPDTLARPYEWRSDAACIGLLDLFFPSGGRPESTDEIRKVCASCPVRENCLTEAMLEERNEDEHRRAGVRGGLTAYERASLSRRIRNTPPGEETPLISEVKARQVRTPSSVLEERTTALAGGHTAWVGSTPVTVDCHSYTPRQLVWQVTYGRLPEGSLTAKCGHKGCVTASHLVDRGATPTGCGTSSGYHAHRVLGEDACRKCKDANADADRRLRNTGTTRAKASA